nr:MAG TPA: hypothetical protein [Caudoviricetes sp.]
MITTSKSPTTPCSCMKRWKHELRLDGAAKSWKRKP